MMFTREPRQSSVALVGFALALAMALSGLGLEKWRFGWSDDQAYAKVEREVRNRVDVMLTSLRDRAALVADQHELIVLARDDEDALRQLFDRLATQSPAVPSDVSVTVYNLSGAAFAWAGRPTELPSASLLGPDAFFTAPRPRGLELVHVRAVLADSSATATAAGVRVASVATEISLSSSRLEPDDPTADYILDTSLAPVRLQVPTADRHAGPGTRSFLIEAPQGGPLLSVDIAASDLAAARSRLRGRVFSLILLLLSLTSLTMVPGQLAVRARARTVRQDVWPRLRLLGLVAVSAGLVWMANPTRWWFDTPTDMAVYTAASLRPFIRSPLDLLSLACASAATVTLLLDALRRTRLARRRSRRSPTAAPGRFLVHQLLAGLVLAGMLIGFARWLQLALEGTTIDLTHFSLHPWVPQRVALMLGLVVAHAALLWAGVAACLAASLPWRMGGIWSGWWTTALVARMTPLLLVWGAAGIGALDVPAPALVVSGAACAFSAAVARPLLAWHRHSSQASRLLATLLVLLGPALLLYPSVVHLAERTKRDLIAERFAPQTILHPDRLRQNLDLAMSQIDAMPRLTELVASRGDGGTGPPPSERAFRLWRTTTLAASRLTSAIQLYDRDGQLVSRFSMNLPEDLRPHALRHTDACNWTSFAESASFGSAERRLFHADRAICDKGGRTVGAISVEVMLDYGTLPFISSQDPYFELFRGTPQIGAEGAADRDVALVIYGWSGRPIYSSGPVTWQLEPALFDRVASSREPIWTTLAGRETRYAVYLTNDRGGIYALGYPIEDTLERVVQLVELATLAAIGYVLFLVLASAINEITRREASSGRALFREIRESFYRTLFLAFVATSVVPLIILAFVMRSYFANRLRLDVETEAARTATVVQRVIEESLAAQQRELDSPRAVTDATMVSISNIIEQDVNIFAGPQLVATSERDLFASGLLSTRTPQQVYRAIELQRQPQFVGEDELAGIRYMLAAAPVRLGSRDAILTVPQTLRQQEIEREIDELDRRVYLAAILFSLLGAALGFSMAERIADPVSRLTRATRRIARGDFDAAVATRSADELEQLVTAFNRMATDLKAQRARLERTNRLEAWAEMARQVAHEIKNPLTPIQLSTEHLRRVHADRGAPLGRVFEGCVESILKQVHLLRQIAAEFSSFASSPQARPSQVAVAGLIREVVDPYRPGIAPEITLTTDVPEGVPAVFIDRTLVARALTNLIENALHAMPDGGRIAIVARSHDGQVEIGVSDTGRGMDAASLERVFEPYFSTKATGTGLGLTIAKRNVELTNGSIDITSSPGRGTTVTLTLPTSDGSLAVDDSSPASTS